MSKEHTVHQRLFAGTLGLIAITIMAVTALVVIGWVATTEAKSVSESQIDARINAALIEHRYGEKHRELLSEWVDCGGCPEVRERIESLFAAKERELAGKPSFAEFIGAKLQEQPDGEEK